MPGSLAPHTPLRFVPGIGPARARALADAGYETVLDLLHHLPGRYEDRREVSTVAQAVAGGEGSCTVAGRLADLRLLRARRLRVVRGRVTDASGSLAVVWFNRPYLASQTDPAAEYLLHGPLRAGKAGPELVNPSCERRGGETVHGGRLTPVYPAIRGLGAPLLRRLFAALLAGIDLQELPEPLPPDLLARHGLPSLGEALAALHSPGTSAGTSERSADPDLLNRRRSPGHLRLIYGEFLELQLALALLRQRAGRQPRRHAYRFDERVRQMAREVLPFRLTGAQKRALKEIADDLKSPWPMLRLLQGDVGSGKTIVAALALTIALENGYQGAFMAPTELLAEQHHASLVRLLGSRYRVGLLVGGARDLARSRQALAAGEIQLAVGTHALIQEGTAFRRLGLAVVDEQHRFGVEQRQFLAGKGDRPDLLVMTATPIPRSLALTAYGDLPVSVLDELPPGRSPIATEVQPAGRRKDVYRRLREALAEGDRAYVVFPLIEGSDEIEAAAVAQAGEGVRAYLAEFKSAVLHGRLPAEERLRVMRAFAAGEIRVLLATTVIEVGIDVPEATWMVIESAERFGLAQLHQLRGRVGRGERPSRCIALTSRQARLTEEGRRRLEVFAATTDGFAIAEADLAIRGPGDLLGTRQAGLPTFRVADVRQDLEWLEKARDDARELLARMEADADAPAFAELRRRVEPWAEGRSRRLGGG
ncbi:MAG TPA: ATP-dependent DNA helicase RecG [Thermoanaerobaculia bacterium]|nr:ATP-dependent DNA helicase RecG [Thermoanaerobaculia bacterium]